jgi:ubiquinone/menaquinone biosynthesis C-methylase UbiE
MPDYDVEKLLAELDATVLREYDAALDLAGFAAGVTILDVATGPGRMLLQLLRRGYSVVSGDIDPAALDQARERLGELADRPTLVVLDAHHLQFAADSFGGVTLANAIHEMPDPRGALDEIARVLTPDGQLLVAEFNARGFDVVELRHRREGHQGHTRGEMSTAEIDRYLRSAFAQVETREFTLTNAWVASGKQVFPARPKN